MKRKRRVLAIAGHTKVQVKKVIRLENGRRFFYEGNKVGVCFLTSYKSCIQAEQPGHKSLSAQFDRIHATQDLIPRVREFAPTHVRT